MASQGTIRWLRLDGVAALLFVIGLLGATVSSAALGPHDAASTAGLDRLVSRSTELAPPARINLSSLTSQPELFRSAVGALVAIACSLWRCLVSRCVDTAPPRFAPGRRGRALLHAYLN